MVGRVATTLTATEAAKRFSAVLDDLEHGHESVFLIERHGRAVARIEAGPQPRMVRWSDVLRALTEAPAPDEAYATDVAAARNQLDRATDPWASS